MRKFWLSIEGPPGRQFATDRSLFSYMQPGLSKYYGLKGIGVLRSSVDGENVNLECKLDNASGVVTNLFLGRSPLGSFATLYQLDKGVTSAVFTGKVYSVAFSGNECTVGLQT